MGQQSVSSRLSQLALETHKSGIKWSTASVRGGGRGEGKEEIDFFIWSWGGTFLYSFFKYLLRASYAPRGLQMEKHIVYPEES